MKAYPYELLRTEDGTELAIPTEEALKNFESYLDPDELDIYNNLRDDQKLRIALSVNPFKCFITRRYL